MPQATVKQPVKTFMAQIFSADEQTCYGLMPLLEGMQRRRSGKDAGGSYTVVETIERLNQVTFTVRYVKTYAPGSDRFAFNEDRTYKQRTHFGISRKEALQSGWVPPKTK